jgi:hypothetical protein
LGQEGDGDKKQTYFAAVFMCCGFTLGFPHSNPLSNHFIQTDNELPPGLSISKTGRKEETKAEGKYFFLALRQTLYTKSEQ